MSVTRFTVDTASRGAVTVRLCRACARQEAGAEPGLPPEPDGPERFGPLHAHALRLLARLEATYDVTRGEAFPASPGALLTPAAQARPPVLLTPRLPEAAPLAVAFTSPPGLVVRCGRWHEAAFGAAFGWTDQPGVTYAMDVDRLDDLVGKVVDGLFAEAVRLPLLGSARLSHAFGDGTRREGVRGEGWMLISRSRARALIGSGPRAVRWRPWPRRRSWAGTDVPAGEPGAPA